jgi:hypothetical protein
MAIIDELLRVIHDTAAAIPTFDHRLGPGAEKGNGATAQYVRQVNEIVRSRWPAEVIINQPAIPKAGLDFDFYVPSEQTAVEIALSIRNPVSEFEKDVFKALMAGEHGLPVKRLILVGKNGSVKIRNMPGSRAIMEWAQNKGGLTVEVHEIAKAPSSALEQDAGQPA